MAAGVRLGKNRTFTLNARVRPVCYAKFKLRKVRYHKVLNVTTLVSSDKISRVLMNSDKFKICIYI